MSSSFLSAVCLVPLAGLVGLVGLVDLGLGIPPAQEPQQDAHVPGEAEPFHLVFAWPESGSVRVTVEVERSGARGRYACTVSWAPEEQVEDGVPRARVVRYSDFEFFEINGRKRGEPGFQALNDALAPALAAVPPFRVGADGEFVGLLGSADLDAGLAAAYEGLAPGASETLRALLSDPMRRAAAEHSTAEDWAWWGSFWNDYESAPGEAVTSEISLPSGLTGQPITGALTMECVDRHVRDGLDAVHMRARTTYAEEDMLRITLATLRMLSGTDVPEGAIRSVSRFDELDGVYALDGLRPLEVWWSKTITVDDGSGPEETVESRRWSFAWPE